jgi:hypothetical protein
LIYYNSSGLINSNINYEIETTLYDARGGTIYLENLILENYIMIYTEIIFKLICGRLCGKSWQRDQFLILDSNLNVVFGLILYGSTVVS